MDNLVKSMAESGIFIADDRQMHTNSQEVVSKDSQANTIANGSGLVGLDKSNLGSSSAISLASTARWSCNDMKDGDLEFGELNKCAESSELNACSGLFGFDKPYIGSSTATALGRPVQLTTGVQS